MGGKSKRRRSMATAVVPALSLALPWPARSLAGRWLAANMPFLRLATSPWPRRALAAATPGQRPPMPWLMFSGFVWPFGSPVSSSPSALMPASEPVQVSQYSGAMKRSSGTSAGSGDSHTEGDRSTPGRRPIGSQSLWLMPMCALRAEISATGSPAPDWRRAARLAAAPRIPMAGMVPEDSGRTAPTASSPQSQPPSSHLAEAGGATDSIASPRTASPLPERPSAAGEVTPVSTNPQSIIALVQKRPTAGLATVIAASRHAAGESRIASSQRPRLDIPGGTAGSEAPASSAQVPHSRVAGDGAAARAAPAGASTAIPRAASISAQPPAAISLSSDVSPERQSIIDLVQRKSTTGFATAIAASRHAAGESRIGTSPRPRLDSPGGTAASSLGRQPQETGREPRSSPRGAAGSNKLMFRLSPHGVRLRGNAVAATRLQDEISRGTSAGDASFRAISRPVRVAGMPLPARVADIHHAHLADRTDAGPLPSRVVALSANEALDPEPAGRRPTLWAPEVLQHAPPSIKTVLDSVRMLVEREVKKAVGQPAVRAPSTLPDEQAEQEPRPAASEPMATDELARELLHRMKEFAQEDRFRCGLLNGT